MKKPELRKFKLNEMRANNGRKSEKITENLSSLEEFSAARDVFLYISDPIEVDTIRIADECLKNGKNVYCPVIRNGQIMPGQLNNISELKPGRFGIKEPQKISKKQRFDAMIIPGVVFDKNGARIGRGGGHFDRFLAKTAGTRIGLAFDFQIIDKIDSEAHDVPMDIIVTEQRIIPIKKQKTRVE